MDCATPAADEKPPPRPVLRERAGVRAVEKDEGGRMKDETALRFIL
jgi:hypothetical protein